MNIKDAKNIPLDEFLEHLGQVCAKVSGGRKWYRAPWREEKTPSLVLTKDRFAWYDHGEGTGGSIIELAMRYGDLRDVSDALGYIERAVGGGYSLQPARMEYKPVETELPYYELIRSGNFRAYIGRGLSKGARYLTSRSIYPDAVLPYVKDVKFNVRNDAKKIFYGIGIENNSGGFEVRSDMGRGYQKLSVGPKDLSFFPSTVRNSQNGTLHIFEGAPDFYTYLTWNSKKINSINPAAESYLILNGTGMTAKAIKFLQAYPFKYVAIWSQYGEGGKKMEDELLANLRDQDCVASSTKEMYKGYNDFNEWYMAKNKTFDAAV
jgi:hypothetical protein